MAASAQRLAKLAGRHRFLAGVLMAAALVRLATMAAYGPALFFSDSWAYARIAWQGALVGLAPDRPNGYAVLLKLLAPSRELAPVVALQHLAGMLAAVLVYAIARRAGASTAAAAAAAAFVALDGKAVALHQHVLAEAFFTLALLSAAWLVVTRPRSAGALAAAGALVAAASLLRTAGLFVLPVFALYLLWRRAPLRAAAAAAACALVPLLGYAAVMHSKWDRFGLTAAEGWFLYGRTIELGRCDRLELDPVQHEVCRRSVASGAGAAYLLYHPSAPAVQAYGGIGAGRPAQLRSNRALGDLARKTIRDRPVRYLATVAGDFGRFFVPGERSAGSSDSAVTLPARPLDGPPALIAAARDRLLPEYEPPAGPPAGLLHVYGRVVTTPRPLLALSLLVALAAMLRRTRRRPELFLLGGCAVALLAGPVATSEFIVRYLVPAVPFALVAGAVGVATLRSTP